MKKQIEIYIPNSKESERLPNKNRLLRQYTLDWLEEELKTLPKDWQVSVLELRNERVKVDTSNDCKLSFTIEPRFAPNEASHEMQDLLHRMTDNAPQDAIKVLLQLTQPKRRKGLLLDAIKAHLRNPELLTTSFVEQPFEAWRIVRFRNWNEYSRTRKDGQSISLYDGAVYAWRGDCSVLW